MGIATDVDVEVEVELEMEVDVPRGLRAEVEVVSY